MNKNVSGQKIQLFAFDTTTNLPKTGDAANITAYVSKDHGAVTVLGDTSATEMDATNAKGVYIFDLTQGETNADELTFTAKSSTSNVSVTPRFVTTNPPSFSAFVTPTGAAVNATQIGGQTASAAGTVTFPGTIASTTNITAGTITTVTNLTNAPSAGDFTATMKTSIGTAVAASAVASVTGNVGGNVTGSIGSLGAQAKLDVNAEADTALADAGVTTTVTGRIDAAISTRLAGASYAAPLDAAGTRSAVGLASANLDTQIATLATAANLATVAGYIDTEVAAIKAKTDNLPASPAATGDIVSAAAIADAVWDEVLSGHLTSGTTGNALNAAGAAGDPWSTALPGAYGSGTAGKIVGDNLNATVSSRLATASYTAPLDAAGTRSAVGLASANLDTQLDALPTNAELATALAAADDAVLAQVALVKAKTDSLNFTTSGQVDANVQYVNDVAVTGNGQVGNEWGPA